MTAEQQLKKFLLQKRTPLFSSKYEIHQAMYYQKLHKLFYSSLPYTPSWRWDISKIQNTNPKQAAVTSHRFQCLRHVP